MTKSIIFQDVIKYYKAYTHQDKALNSLSASLTDKQVADFYLLWYADTIRPDNVPLSSSASDFDLAYAFTCKWEGGYVNHPSDPGGATNYGITQSTYDEWRQNNNLSTSHVSYLTQQEAKDIYRSYYWLLSLSHECPRPVNLALFDSAVNFGVRGGIQFLQEAVNVSADGIFGKVTWEALKRNGSPLSVALKIVDHRIEYRHFRCSQNPSQTVFLNGWLNRDHALRDYLLKVCKSNPCN